VTGLFVSYVFQERLDNHETSLSKENKITIVLSAALQKKKKRTRNLPLSTAEKRKYKKNQTSSGQRQEEEFSTLLQDSGLLLRGRI
jgi:hypothetical protein